MRASIYLVAAVLLTSAIVDAQPCPPVRFLNTPQVTVASRLPRLHAFGLLRQPDGSFQSREYFRVAGGLAPSSIQVGPVRNGVEAEFYRCSGFAPAVHMPNPDVIPFSETRLGVSAQQLILGDFTGEGLVSSAGIDRRIAPDAVIVIRLNTAFELTQPAVAYPTGRNPGHVLAGDFNGDGSVDLAVTFDGPFDRSAPGGVSVLLNNGDGTFGKATDTFLGNFVQAATAWDWNEDEQLDLAVTQHPSELLVLEGNGDGSFAAPVSLGEAGFNLAAADVTQDERVDLLVTGSPDGFSYFPATPGGGFGARVSTGIGAGYLSIAADDFNEDGMVDVVLGSLAVDQVGIALNTGAGAFATPAIYQVGRDPESLMTTDFDGDGNRDVLLASGHPQILISNLASPTIAALRGQGDGSFIGRQVLGSAQEATGLAIADFDRDTLPDVAVSSQHGPIAVFLGDGDRSFGEATLTETTRNRLSAIGAGEFNGDSDPDVAVADSGWVAVLHGDGDGTFSSPKSRTALPSPVRLVVADFDASGRDDVVVASSDAVQTFLSNSDGTLAPGRGVPVPTPIDISDLIAADLNSDGLADLVVADRGEFQGRAGAIHVLLATGGGMFARASSITTGNSANGVAAVDFSGDENLDLVVTANGDNFTWNLVFLKGDGAGGFVELGRTPTEFGPGRMAHADLNSDGVEDLVVLHCCGRPEPTFLLGDGVGSFQPEVAFFGGADPSQIEVADFNRDGRLDLAILSDANAAGNGVTLLINESDPAGPVHVSAASFASGPVAPGMLVTAFGVGFADEEEAASSTPLPTELAGTRVAVWDAAGVRRESQLIFMNPGQANYLLDSQTALGPALISIEPSSGNPLTAQVQVDRIAPGLFFLNGDFLAAAQILRVRGSGEQVLEAVFEFDEQGAIVPRAIDFGPPEDRLFLVLFGTGFRRRAGLNLVRVIIDGIEHATLFAGDQGIFAGLDQSNAQLSRELTGRGDVDVLLEVENETTNTVRLRFQ